MLRISHRARDVLQHFQQSIAKRAKRFHDRDDSDQGVRYVALLVWDRAAKYAKQFNDLLNRHCWNDILEQSSEVDSLPARHLKALESVVVVLILNLAAEFDLRVVSRTRKFPEKLLLFCQEDPAFGCACRKRLAAEILAMPEEQLEINTLKFKLLYHDDLIKTASEGTLSTHMHAHVLTVARAWAGDSQNLEPSELSHGLMTMPLPETRVA